MRLNAIILFLTIALSGCATCREETFIKPQLKVGNRVIAPWNQEKGFDYSLTQDVELFLIGCNYLADQANDFICVGIRPNPGTEVKFSSAQYQRDSNQSLDILTEDIPVIRLLISFFPDKSGMFPSQTERKKGLPESAIETEISGNQYAQEMEFSFPAIAQFQGDKIVGTTFSLAQFLRTFYFKLPFPKDFTQTVTLKLPPILINGKSVAFPAILAKKVTENICYSPK